MEYAQGSNPTSDTFISPEKGLVYTIADSEWLRLAVKYRIALWLYVWVR